MLCRGGAGTAASAAAQPLLRRAGSLALCLAGSFAVLPLGFLVHAPHPWSKSKRGWMKKGRGKHATDKLFKEADSKYDEASLRDGATPLCPGAKT